MAKTITRTISLREDVFEKINNYCDKYFQGNMSACVVFMCVNFLENKEIPLPVAKKQ